MRICSGAGCLRAVRDDVRMCDECSPVRRAEDDIKNHTSGYDRELDGQNKSGRWQRISRSVIRSQPLCARCELSISVLTDHIVPAREAISQTQLSGKYLDKYAGYYLRSNLQGLCRPCHWVKTLEDKTHVGAWPDVVATEQAAPKRTFVF